MHLLTGIGGNPKLTKSDKKSKKYISVGLHLKPSKKTCPFASKGCLSGCLNGTGRGCYPSIQKARQKRTDLFFNQPEVFKYLLYKDLESICRKAKKLKKIPAVRLNLTSDISWEKVFPEIFTDFPQIQFYDYTKNPNRCMKSCKLPSNYYLCFSKSEINKKDVKRVVRSGKSNVVVVFKEIPKTYLGKKVFNGEQTDLRFLDPPGIVGMRAKGKAKTDKTGFVV